LNVSTEEETSLDSTIFPSAESNVMFPSVEFAKETVTTSFAGLGNKVNALAAFSSKEAQSLTVTSNVALLAHWPASGVNV